MGCSGSGEGERLGTTNGVSLPQSYQRADVGVNGINACPDQVLFGYPDEAGAPFPPLLPLRKGERSTIQLA